jgi:RNA polymerase-binding transcription factor DksA
MPTKKTSSTAKKAAAKKPVAKKAAAKKPAAKKAATTTTKRRATTKATARKSAGKSRYTDEELMEFKDLIDGKLVASKKELKYLQDQISRTGSNGTDDTENKFLSLDDSNASMEREYLTQMASRQQQFIDHLEKALIRIKNKTYGICRETGKLISKARLQAVPHATLSIDAKNAQKR